MEEKSSINNQSEEYCFDKIKESSEKLEGGGKVFQISEPEVFNSKSGFFKDREASGSVVFRSH